MKGCSKEALCLVIDVQERLVPVMRRPDGLVTDIVRLIHGMRILGIPVLATEQYPRGLGKTVPEITGALGESQEYWEKLSFSAFRDPAIQQAVQDTGRRQVILAGIEAHVCVMQTARDLLEAGFHPVIPADCVSSRKKQDCKRALRRLEREGVVVTTSEALLFELLEAAGTPEFKEISRLVK